MADLNLKFGQVPFWAICRFGEISKIEIMVFSFICAKRFRDTETADCPRSEIIEYTKLDKSQISIAINKLKAINWLVEKAKTKWFIPELEPAKVEKSSTKPKAKKVVESSTNVEESSTKVEESSTPLYKESSSDHSDKQTNTKNIAETSSARPAKKPIKMRSVEYKPFRESLFKFHNDRLNGNVHNHAAINDAIGWLFDHKFSRDDCLTYYAEQMKELRPNGWRTTVSWLTVKQHIADWIAQGKPSSTENKNGTNASKNGKGTNNGNGYNSQDSSEVIANLRRLKQRPTNL